MRSDIENFCNLCKTCEAFQKAVPKHRAPLQSIQTDRPFQLVCTDITELPVTSVGNRYVLVVQDHFTKYANAYAMSDQKAATVAQLLCERYIPEHGVPEELLSDQGRQYESEIIHTICQRLQMTKKITSPYCPRGNGMVERFNRTLKEQLARLIQDYGGEWDHYLPAVVLSFNSTPHSSTGYSPYFLAHGREPRLPANVHISSPKVSDCPQNYGSELATRMDAAFETVVLHHKEQRQKREYYYDKDTRFRPYACGNLVWIDDPTTQRQKLSPNWTGPFKVVSVDEKGLLYKLVDVKYPQAATRVIHYDRLKPYRSSTDTLPTDVSQSVFPPNRDTLPRYTALSGSLPWLFGQTAAAQTSGTTRSLPSSPRNPTGLISHQPTQPPPSLPPSGGAVITRHGRTVRKPQRLLL
uniref:Integrase catalytic domain-containing protein n=1 Tax=Poecilia mexicana TaxID=48701 RepID=A0A3B3WTS4_9TELE